MDPLSFDELVIRVDQSDPGRLRLDWLGRSTSRDPVEVLDPFFGRAIQEASANGSLVEMHFEALEYFNSSTIVALIHVIKRAAEAAVALRFIYDAGVKWQTLVFDPLKRAVASFGLGQGPQVQFVGAEIQRQ